MSDHEQVRQLLSLSAAGLLDAGEERLVREHTESDAAFRVLETSHPPTWCGGPLRCLPPKRTGAKAPFSPARRPSLPAFA